MNMVCFHCETPVHKVGDYWYHDIDVTWERNPERRMSVTRQLSTIAREVMDLDAKVE